MRIGIESFPPLILSGTRHLTVGIVFYTLVRWRTNVRPTLAHWRTAAITGCLLQFMGNGAVCAAEKTVPSGIASLLVAMVCLWMVLIDWLRPGGHHPGARVLFGLVLGFGGLAMLVGPKNLGGSGVDPIGSAILAVGSFAWACGSIYSKHGALPRSPLLGVAMQSFCGGIALWITSFLTGQASAFHATTVSARSWIALAYLIVFGSMLGFTAYMYMLKKSTATKVSTYALVNPVVALLLGWVVAGERITGRTAIAGAIILTAVLLVITAPHPKTAPDEVLPAGSEA